MSSESDILPCVCVCVLNVAFRSFPQLTFMWVGVLHRDIKQPRSKSIVLRLFTRFKQSLKFERVLHGQLWTDGTSGVNLCFLFGFFVFFFFVSSDPAITHGPMTSSFLFLFILVRIIEEEKNRHCVSFIAH